MLIKTACESSIIEMLQFLLEKMQFYNIFKGFVLFIVMLFKSPPKPLSTLNFEDIRDAAR